jgi:hypothetical protein
MVLVQSYSEVCVLFPGLRTTKKLPTIGETKNEGGKKQVKMGKSLTVQKKG